MSPRKSKAAEKSMTVFFVVLAVLFAFMAGVMAVHYFEKRESGQTASETETEMQTETTEAPVVTTETTSPPPGPGEKVVYLTFDDGPTTNTVNILNVLEQYGVRGTFFVIHTYDGCEAQIREIYRRGHCVGLHTYSHLYKIYSSQEAYFEDLGKISDLVYQATGTRSMLVRFPGGSSNTISRKYCQGIMTTLTQELPKRGYEYFDWNADSFDASKVHVPVETIVQKSTESIGKLDKVILLMHDAQAKTTTVDALPEVIRAYREAGYRFDVLSKTSFTWHHTVNN